MVDRGLDFDVDGDEEDASGTGAAAAAEKSWMGWTLAQGAIGLALLMIFDLFASIKGDDTLPDDEQPKQSLAPVLMLLLVLHAVVAKSCIRSVCQRLQLLLCAMLWLDAVFQVPITLLYHAPKDPPSPPDTCNDASCSWPATCLQNAMAISRAAEVAGVKIGLGSVAIAPVAAFLIVMMLQLLIESQWYKTLEQSTAVSAWHAKMRGAAWFAAEHQYRARAMLARRAELELSRLRVHELRRMMSTNHSNKGGGAPFPHSLHTADTRSDQGVAGEEMQAGSSPTRKTSHAAEKAAVILATPNIPNCAEDGVAAGGGLRAQGAADVVKGGEGVDGHEGMGGSDAGADTGLAGREDGEEWERRRGGEEGVLEGVLRVFLVVYLDCMYSLRQTGPFLDFEAALKPLEPLECASIVRLLALSLDELGYFVSTYTHMICYGALVLSHAMLCTPASGVAVFFVLAMAAFQEPYPARWYWNVTMTYLAFVSGAKVSAHFLEQRMCGEVWDSSTWVCAWLLPAWDRFAGDGSAHHSQGWLSVVDFATLLVLAAHRANMQYRGLWLDVGPSDLIPPPAVVAEIEQLIAPAHSEQAAARAGGALPVPKRLRDTVRGEGGGMHSPTIQSPRSNPFMHTGAVSSLTVVNTTAAVDVGEGAGGRGLRQRRSGNKAEGAMRTLRDSVSEGTLHSPIPHASEIRRGARGRDSDVVVRADAPSSPAAGGGHRRQNSYGGNQSSRSGARPVASLQGGAGKRVVRSVGVVGGWGGGAWRWWLQKNKVVWLANDSDMSDTTGTGVDLYLWVVTPELLALVAVFGGLLSSGSDVPNKLQTLASGSVVDWQTLGWVFLAFFQFVVIVVDRVLYLRRAIFSKAVLQVGTLVIFFSLFFFNMQQPLLTDNTTFVLGLFLVKCGYWIFSARQVQFLKSQL